VKGAFERLEPRAVKVACAVLRGLGGSNAPRLPDHLTALSRAEFEAGFVSGRSLVQGSRLQGRAARLSSGPLDALYGRIVGSE
jgi:hypothetical protein